MLHITLQGQARFQALAIIEIRALWLLAWRIFRLVPLVALVRSCLDLLSGHLERPSSALSRLLDEQEHEHEQEEQVAVDLAAAEVDFDR